MNGLQFSANLGFLWRDLPLAEAIGRASAAGFDALEFHDQPADDAEALAALRQAGLPVEAVNTLMGPTAGLCALPDRRADAREAIETAVRVARAIGARAIHATAGRCDPSPESRAAYGDALDLACDLCGAEGMSVVIEPISSAGVQGYFLHSLDQALDVIAGYGQGGPKLLFDVWHMDRMGHDPAAAFAHAVERVGIERIGHVQIAGLPERQEPQPAVMAPLIARLQKAGYRGRFGCEYRPAGRVEDGLDWLAAMRAT